ncbi:MAG TPA: Hsp20/alpha crystallin family protein [Anaerolineales bacterium]|nr:Hsp20/alpha crystallin family protein [Anaerolineales bacterium]
MVEVELKSDRLRPGWYISDEIQHITSGINRGRASLARPHVWRPPTDVYETEDVVVVRVEVAGLRDDDFSISLAGRSLSIRGTRQDVSERRAYHQMEITFGEFLSEVELPCSVLAEKASAEYKTGFLHLWLPKEQPVKISVDE